MNDIKVKLKSGEVLQYPITQKKEGYLEVGYNRIIKYGQKVEMKRQWPKFWVKKEVVVREAGEIEKFTCEGWINWSEVVYAVVNTEKKPS